jgi:hypothetical protein
MRAGWPLDALEVGSGSPASRGPHHAQISARIPGLCRPRRRDVAKRAATAKGTGIETRPARPSCSDLPIWREAPVNPRDPGSDEQMFGAK